MLTVRSYQTARAGSEPDKSMRRARELKPQVTHLFTDVVDRESYYLVKRTDKRSKHVTRVWVDPDGEAFISCPCYRGWPPMDSKTKLPAFEPMSCLHAAATLLYIAEEHSEDTGVVIPFEQRRNHVNSTPS